MSRRELPRSHDLKRRAVSRDQPGIGTYRVVVEKAGFVPAERPSLPLSISETVRADFTLKIGGIVDEVTVTGDVAGRCRAEKSFGCAQWHQWTPGQCQYRGSRSRRPLCP